LHPVDAGAPNHTSGALREIETCESDARYVTNNECEDARRDDF
jgi:hypothetical protein